MTDARSKPQPPAVPREAGGRACWGAVAAVLVAGALALGLLRVIPAGAAAAADPMSAMALSLLRTTQFTSWPAGAFASTNAPVVVAVVGRDPFGGKLEPMFRNDLAAGRPLVLRWFRADEDPGECHVLFVGEVDEARCRALLRRVADRPVLTAGTRSGFCAMGGMVMLSTERERVLIEIRRDAVQNARLSVDSRLLNLKVVRIYGEPVRP